MAEQAPRSIVNMVFILLLLVALAGAVALTWDMIQDAISGPGMLS